MSDLEHIEDYDLVWIAVDQKDQVAAFITAGSGVVPESARADLFDVEEKILAQASTRECTLHINVPRPDSYIALATRGYVVYDWFEPGKRDSCYVLAARPSKRLTVSELPDALRSVAERTRLDVASFDELETIVL